MKFSTIILLVSLILINQVSAQNIGINGTGANPNASALLDIDDAGTNNKGLLIPRIPLTAINAAAPVTSPATSLLVYNTASASTGANAVSPGYYYWDGTKWVRFSYSASGSSANDWNLLGNSGTNPTTNFLGTTDAQDLVFRTNNLEAVRINTLGYVGVGTNNPTQTRMEVFSSDINTRHNFRSIFSPTLSSNYSGSSLVTSFNRFVGTTGFDINVPAYGAVNRVDILATQTGSLTFAIGSLSDVYHGGNNLISNAIGAKGGIYNTSTGPITNAYGVFSDIQNSSSGVITNGYGVFTGSVTGTNKWSFYASDATAPNYFAGRMGIGTSIPANKLEITQGTAGNSGLRFTNLPNASVLKTDANGDVVPATASTATNNGVFWALNGNSGTNPATNFLGTTDAQDLVFKTNNIEAVRVTTSGILRNNLFSNAIGTDGQGISNNSLGFQNNQGAFTASFYNALSGNYSNGVLIKSLSTSSLTTLLDVSTGTVNAMGVPIFNVKGNGNVGIGTSSPTTRLDVIGKSFVRLQATGNNTSIQLDPTVSETPKMSFHASDNTNRFNVVANLFTSQASDVLTFNSISTNNILNITNGGNVGLGTTSPGDKLSVGGRAEFQTTLNDHGVRISADPTNTHSKLQFTDIPVTVEWASIQAFPSGGGQLSFITNNAPRVTVLNNGYVGIATNTPSYNLQVSGVSYIDGKCIAERAGAANPMFEARKTDAGAGSMILFITNGGTTGEISTSGASTAYNTTSDIRLKENIRPISKGLNDLLKIGVKEYSYKADESKKTETGFIAQELYEIYPQAVQKGGDDAKTNPWMIDYSKLTPLLVKGIQEQQQEIENLKQAHKSEIENLLKRIEALEKK